MITVLIILGRLRNTKSQAVEKRLSGIPFLSVLCFIMASLSVHAQSNVLDRYIKEALIASPLIIQKEISATRADLAEDLARSYYLPTAGFQMGYQTAKGGRSIDLPVGDMLNGVYGTLNQLTGTQNFPQIDNQQINFLPVNFYDAKIRANIPIYNADIKHQIALAENQQASASIDLNLQKRILISQVKEAYFNYLMAREVGHIYQEALSLAAEGRRVNERLLTNGKGLPAYVLRSDAEIQQINAEIYQADVQSENAAAWFNFLLNRQADTPIDTLFDEADALGFYSSLNNTDSNTKNREELAALKNAGLIYSNMVALNKSAVMPRLNGVIDVGSQSENFKFNNQSRYILLGLQLDIPIYSANRIKNKTAQAQLDLDLNLSRIEYVTEQINLSAETSVNNLNAALEVLNSLSKQLEAATSYRRLIDRGYTEGVSTFIETIDARNQLTQAQLARKIQIYKVLLAGVAVEKELALYKIDQ